MENMDLFDEEELGLLAPDDYERPEIKALELNHEYNINRIGEKLKVVVRNTNYEHTNPYEVFTQPEGTMNIGLQMLRLLVPDIEDYNMPLEYYKMKYKFKPCDKLGDDFEEKIAGLDLSSPMEDVAIRGLELEGLAIDLIFTPEDMHYHYLINKKVDFDKWETLEFVNVTPNLKVEDWQAELFNVCKEYAKENKLYFTRIND